VDANALTTAYARLKRGTLWSSTGKCKGYAVANPGEAAKIDAYVAALVTDGTATPPTLATDTGSGIVGMLAAMAAAPSPPPPPPPPPSGRHWGISPASNSPPSIDTQMADYVNLGITCPRLDGSDTQALSARSHGFKTWVTWAGNTGYMWTPAQAVTYCQKYPECIAIELGNELNLNSTWTVAAVATMQKAFWVAMKAAGLESRVMLPSVGNSPSSNEHLLPLDWCKRLAANGISYGNGISVGNYHMYGLDPQSYDNWMHVWTPDSSGVSCQSALGHPPFFVTEFGAKIGWSGVTEATQAQAAVAWVAKLASVPDCIGGQWFLDYDGTAWTGFGLQDAANNHRHSYTAFQTAVGTYKKPLVALRPSDAELGQLHAAKASAYSSTTIG